MTSRGEKMTSLLPWTEGESCPLSGIEILKFHEVIKKVIKLEINNHHKKTLPTTTIAERRNKEANK